MPSSYAENVPAVVALMRAALQVVGHPPAVLDVGPGMGKYGVLAREHLNPALLDALEVWEDYRSRFPWTGLLYDHLLVGDMRSFRSWAAYDLVLLIDVIEHVPLQEGIEVLHRIADAGAMALVSTPRHYPQGPELGNPHEAHLSEWTASSFAALPPGPTSDNALSLIRLLLPEQLPVRGVRTR